MSLIFINPYTFAAANWTPAQITTELWFDAADSSTITTASGSVSQWNDKSGNARNATQATAANQPAHSTTGFNGLPGVTFDGTNDTMIHGLNTGGPFSLVAVYKTGSLQSAYRGVMAAGPNNSGGNLMLMRTFGGTIGSFGTSDINSTVSYVVGQTVMVIVEDDNTNGSKAFWINGSSSGTYTQNPIGQATAHIGGLATDSQQAAMTLAECLVLPGIPTTTNRQLVEGYLAHKWALTGSLPAGHPYKTTAPTI
jgi:hypothetical protein